MRSNDNEDSPAVLIFVATPSLSSGKMNPNETSVDIASYIKENYFSLLGNGEISDMYSDNATIFYDDQEFYGKNGASNFSSTIGSNSFRVMGYNAQTIPNSKWSVITLTGTVKTDHIHQFVSTFHIESNESLQKALIFYQVFTVI